MLTQSTFVICFFLNKLDLSFNIFYKVKKKVFVKIDYIDFYFLNINKV